MGSTVVGSLLVFIALFFCGSLLLFCSTREAGKIEIIVNGEAAVISDAWTVEDLVEDLGLQDRQIAVEVNEKIIGRNHWPEQPLRARDRIEIVHFVGGGQRS